MTIKLEKAAVCPQLPPEIWGQIFLSFDLRQLSRLQQVCKLFRTVVQSVGAEVEIASVSKYGAFVKIDDKLTGRLIDRSSTGYSMGFGLGMKAGDKIRVVVSLGSSRQTSLVLAHVRKKA